MSDDAIDRAEHLAWCKRRALEYVDAGDFANAIASMLSDLSKHVDTATYDLRRAALGFRWAHENNPAALRQWIEDFP